MLNDEKNKINYLILSTSRTGSNWLVDLLNFHPHIKAFEEVFNEEPLIEHLKNSNPNLLPPVRYYDFKQSSHNRRPWVTFEYMNELKKTSEEKHAIGFKIMYGQLVRCSEIILKIIWDRYRIIHLIRKNLLDVIISRELAIINKIWHTTKNIEQRKVFLDTKTLYSKLEKDRKQVSKVKLFLTLLPNPVIQVSYEELRADTQATVDNMVQFLNCNALKVAYNSKYKKINPKYHWESIENYDEVYEALKNTKFAYLLDEGRKTES